MIIAEKILDASSIKYGDEFLTAGGTHVFFYKTDGPTFTESYHFKMLTPHGILKYNSAGELLYDFVDDRQFSYNEMQDLQIIEKAK